MGDPWPPHRVPVRDRDACLPRASYRLRLGEDTVTGFAIGQKLWFQPTRWGGHNPAGFEITITKVGRRWLSTNYRQYRLDIDNNLIADGRGHSSPGRAYFSREQCEQEAMVRSAWNQLQRDVANQSAVPSGLMMSDIDIARGLLKLKRST